MDFILQLDQQLLDAIRNELTSNRAGQGSTICKADFIKAIVKVF